MKKILIIALTAILGANLPLWCMESTNKPLPKVSLPAWDEPLLSRDFKHFYWLSSYMGPRKYDAGLIEDLLRMDDIESTQPSSIVIETPEIIEELETPNFRYEIAVSTDEEDEFLEEIHSQHNDEAHDNKQGQEFTVVPNAPSVPQKTYEEFEKESRDPKNILKKRLETCLSTPLTMDSIKGLEQDLKKILSEINTKGLGSLLTEPISEGTAPLDLACNTVFCGIFGDNLPYNGLVLVELLLKEGIDPNSIFDETLETFFGGTSFGPSDDVLSEFFKLGMLLLKYGLRIGDVNQIQPLFGGKTLLTQACKMGNAEYLELLLQKGACIDTADAEGKTPLRSLWENGSWSLQSDGSGVLWPFFDYESLVVVLKASPELTVMQDGKKLSVSQWAETFYTQEVSDTFKNIIGDENIRQARLRYKPQQTLMLSYLRCAERGYFKALHNDKNSILVCNERNCLSLKQCIQNLESTSKEQKQKYSQYLSKCEDFFRVALGQHDAQLLQLLGKIDKKFSLENALRYVVQNELDHDVTFVLSCMDLKPSDLGAIYGETESMTSFQRVIKECSDWDNLIQQKKHEMQKSFNGPVLDENGDAVETVVPQGVKSILEEYYKKYKVVLKLPFTQGNTDIARKIITYVGLTCSGCQEEHL